MRKNLIAPETIGIIEATSAKQTAINKVNNAVISHEKITPPPAV